MGVVTKHLFRGVRNIKRLVKEQTAEEHETFAGIVLKAAKDIARTGLDDAHGTKEDKAYKTGTFHNSISMRGTPGLIMQVGSNDDRGKVMVIEYGSDARGRFPKYIFGRAVGLAFSRSKVKGKGFKVLKGVVSEL